MPPLPPAAVERFRDDVRVVMRYALDGPAPTDAVPTDAARFALAVSGGADSMAMLLLAAAAFPGRVSVATFDHRLRAASADEARLVADACAAVGVPHRILHAERPIAGSSIQSHARAARYAALSRWAHDEGICPLMTAHHADDQAETLLMRLNRASGLAGLSGIRRTRPVDDVVIVRPLLGWRCAELRAIVEQAGIPFVDDPSNADPRHDRTHARAALAATPLLDPAALAASAAYLSEAEEVVVRAAALLWSERWFGPERPFAIAGEPRELRRRLVRRAIAEARHHFAIVLPAFGDSSNVEALIDALERGHGAVQGGVKVDVAPDGWLFRPAPPRRSH